MPARAAPAPSAVPSAPAPAAPTPPFLPVMPRERVFRRGKGGEPGVLRIDRAQLPADEILDDRNLRRVILTRKADGDP